MNVENCTWINPWTDSGDRGHAQWEHDSQFHPDHMHIWATDVYDWDKPGHVRCAVCYVSHRDDRSGQCG
jgi:hypothetical protein